MQECGHILIKGIHHMSSSFYERYSKSLMCKILRAFKPYEATAYNYSPSIYELVRNVLQRKSILCMTQCEHFIALYAGDLWYNCFRSRRENKVVIAFMIAFTGLEIPYVDTSVLSVD